MTEYEQMSEFKSPVQAEIDQMVEKSCERSPPRTGKKTERHNENCIAEKRQMVYPRHKVADDVI